MVGFQSFLQKPDILFNIQIIVTGREKRIPVTVQNYIGGLCVDLITGAYKPRIYPSQGTQFLPPFVNNPVSLVCLIFGI